MQSNQKEAVICMNVTLNELRMKFGELLYIRDVATAALGGVTLSLGTFLLRPSLDLAQAPLCAFSLLLLEQVGVTTDGDIERSLHVEWHGVGEGYSTLDLLAHVNFPVSIINIRYYF